jgi:predicted amidohydrolase
MTPESRSEKGFAGVGLFHFPVDHGHPFECLESALAERKDVRNSLIVLPEAFNCGEAVFRDNASQRPLIDAGKVIEDLKAIAGRYDLVWVVGLLDPPHNSVYWIEKGLSRLMGHKGTDPELDNPIETNGVCVGALICSDARDNRWGVTAKVKASACARKVVGIPASMSSETFGSPDFPLPEYREMSVVLANAKPTTDSCGSFFVNRGKKLEELTEQRNRIYLTTWDDLDGLGG